MAASPPALLAWCAVGALVVAGLGLRLHGYMVVPRLTDETREVLLGLQIARGEALPLTNIDPYIGALYNYLVAGAFLLLGPRPEVGRLLVVVAGALTIVPTYLLGRSLGGPGARGQWVGLAAATLLAASATHIVVSSRIAYSHSLTPLAATTGLWLLQRALANRSGPSLVASALLFGLALQTHPSALALVPGLGLAVLLQGRTLLTARRGRWLVLSVVAVLLAVGNVLVVALTGDLVPVTTAGDMAAKYAGENPWTPAAFLGRLLSLLHASALVIGGQVSEQIKPWQLASPFVIGSGAFALLGLGSFVRRRAWLPLLALASGLLFVALLNGRIEPLVPRARHYALLLPLALIVVAEGLVTIHGYAARRSDRHRTIALAAVLTALALVGGSVYSLSVYEQDRASQPWLNNRALLTALDAVAANGGPQERVYVDLKIGQQRTISGGRTLTNILYWFRVRDQEYEVVDLERVALPLERPRASRRVMLDPETVAAVAGRYRLVPLAGEPGRGAPVRAFRAYTPDTH